MSSIGFSSWRASLLATIAGAVSGVVLLILVAAVLGTHFDGETVFFMLGVALPVALLVAAPVGFIAFPLARIVLERFEAYTAGRLIIVGGVLGFVLPLTVASRLGSSYVTGGWALTVIFVVASTVAGVISAVVYHQRTEPEPGRTD